MTPPASEAQQLCVNCGVCCGDAMFSRGRVRKDEEARLRKLGFAMQALDDKLYFPIPCPQLRDKVCQVYEGRPQTCRNFRCATLQALDSGEIDRAEADRRVALLQGAIAQLRSRTLPGENLHSLHDRVGGNEATQPDVQLAVVVLNQVVGRYFRPPVQHPAAVA
jgi:Fe-S-cluster containining protein